MKKIVLLAFLFVLSGCGVGMKSDCSPFIDRAFAWVDRMPKISSKSPVVTVKLEVLKKGCDDLKISDAKAVFKEGSCAFKEVSKENMKEKITFVLKGCEEIWNLKKFKLKLRLIDDKGREYIMDSKDLVVRKVY